jgi:acyl-CoA synthetase (AMP-forming)/AMP-acid ligase II
VKSQAIVAAFARAQPDREALVCGPHRLTYEQVERRTNRLARALAAVGVGTGDRVALLLPNGIAWPETCLAALKLGALVVPISTRLTAGEIAFIVADASPALLVYDAELREVAERATASHPCAILGENELYRRAESVADGPLDPVPVDPDDALIGYTSGTTGTPKGAVTTHANLILIALLNNQQFGLNAADRILVTTPFAHRTAVARLWNALTLGATLVIVPRFDAHEALEQIVNERITVAGLVPTVARMLLDALGGDAGRFASLRAIISSGEAFPVALKERLFAALPHVRLFSALGITEAFGAAVLLSEDQVAHAAAAGRPVPGVEVRLLDADGREVPAGEVGEIVVRCGEPGRWLTMRCYWNRPQETATALRAGWFFTGDMGRFDDDGFLYVVDRKKDMILSGGLNIYSKEVEHAIHAHAAVVEAGVVAAPDSQFGEAVVAFVELRPGASATADEIVEHCRALIASYKKPKYVFFEALPRNAQGKVVKTELRNRVTARIAEAERAR